MGKLSPIPLGISEFDETCRFGKRRSKATIDRIFRLRGAEISYLHQVEGQTTEQSPNQGFQKLSLRVKNIPTDNLLDFFMGTLKDNIQHKLCILEPTSLEKTFKLARRVESKKWPCLLKGSPITPINRIMFLLLTYC